MVPRSTDPSRVQSVERAIRVLRALSEEGAGLGLAELSTRVALPMSSVHRLLATLGDHGFVAQDAVTGNYRIGVFAFEVGSAFLRHIRLQEIAYPHIQELSRVTYQTANLALRDGAFATYIDQVQSPLPFQVVPRSGARVPLHCSGVGKVFLAGMASAELNEIVDSVKLIPLTPHSITDKGTLRKSINLVQSQGFAVDLEEMQLGVRCIAAPIYNHLGETVAAVSITGPVSQTSNSDLPLSISHVCKTGNTISEQLGYKPGIGF
jgi:IclR family transcriptional regulator, KDG regulon repressor